MTIALKHAKVSAISDNPAAAAAGEILPSDWNNDHVLTMATARLLGRTTAGTGAAEEISVGSGLSFASGSLSLALTSGLVTGALGYTPPTSAIQGGWTHSARDFADGTIVSTDINYPEFGDPFIIEIRGFPYTGGPPFDIQIGGYIYYDTIIQAGGLSNGSFITGIVALNVAGKLTFWWPRQAYWQGFNVRVYIPFAGQDPNRVTSITNGAKPTGTKEFAFSSSIVQSLHSSNYTDYTLTRLTNTWQTSADAKERIYFLANSHTYIKGFDGIFLRGGDNVDRFQFSCSDVGPYFYMMGSSPTVWWKDSNHRSFAIHVNDSLAYFMRGGVNDTTWTTITDQFGTARWMCTWDLNNGSMTMPGVLDVYNNIYGGNEIHAGRGQAGAKYLTMNNSNRYVYFYTSSEGTETSLYDHTVGTARWRSFSDGSFWIPSGFVALGVSNPTARLDVNGNIRIRGNRYVFFDTTGGAESNYVGVSNDYWLAMGCGRGFGAHIYLRNEGWTQIVSGVGTLAMFAPSDNLPASGGAYVYWAGGFASPVSGRLFIGDNSGWKFHFSSRVSGTTTDRFTFNDNGLFEASLAVQSANFRDSIGAFNVNLANNGTEGRGLVAGFSSSAYPGIGYNIRHVAAGGHIAPGGDTVSYMTFASGGFQFTGATSGAGGRTLSLTTLAAITLDGRLGVGTPSPSHQLHVVGNAYLPLGNSYFCYTTQYGIGTPDSSGLQIFAASGDIIRLGTRTSGGVFTEHARVTPTGLYLSGDELRIGIGQAGVRKTIYWNASRLVEYRLESDGNWSGLYDLSGGYWRNYSTADGSFWIRSNLTVNGLFIAAGGAAGTNYGGVTLQGEKNGWAGMNVRDGSGINCGTMMFRSSDGYWGIYNKADNNWNLQLDGSGNLTATGNVTAYSDIRLKTDWKEVDLSLEEICSITPFEFTRKDTAERQVGIKAQELQKVIPLAVQTDEAGMLSVDYGRAAMVAVAALAKEVAKLKKKLDALTK